MSCAGTDLHEPPSPSTTRGGDYDIVRRRRSTPLIAAVEGTALGGGLEIVLACDLVVAAEDALFGLPEVRIGTIATCAGLFRGPRALPLDVARELVLTGKPLGAPRLHQLGLVKVITGHGETRHAALELADSICENSPISVMTSPSAINDFVAEHDELGWSLTDNAIATIAVSPDRREGIQAFFDRRPRGGLGSLRRRFRLVDFGMRARRPASAARRHLAR